MSSVGRFQLTIDTVACTVGRINFDDDRIALRLRPQRVRKRHPFLWLEAKAKKESRFALSTGVA